ncbi:MAG: hypothetical protein U0935_15285 [Pirellulales bacterium]
MPNLDVRANLETIPLDQLEQRVQQDQLATHELRAFFGWFLLTLVAADLGGNLVGCPFVTGHLLVVNTGVRTESQAPSAWLQTGAVVAPLLQVSLSLLALRGCLHHSYWRLWLRRHDARTGIGRGVRRQLRDDYASLLGVSLAVLLVLITVLIKWQNHWQGRYLDLLLSGQLVPFQLMQLSLLLFLPLIGPRLATTNFGDALQVLLTAPARWPTACLQFDFRQRPIWPVVGLLQHPSLREQKIVALTTTDDDTCQAAFSPARLELMSQPTTFLGLCQLAARIGDGVTEYRDLGEFFVLRTRFEVAARNLDEIAERARRRLVQPLPGRLLGSVIGDLFNSPQPRLLLNRLGQEAFNRFLDDLPANAGDIRGFHDLLRQRRLTLLEVRAQPQRVQVAPAAVTHGTQLALSSGLDAFEPFRASLQRLAPFQQEYLDLWRPFRLKKATVANDLPALFAEELARHFLDGAESDDWCEAWEAFGQCCGIRLQVVDFRFQAGAAQHADEELERLDQEYQQELRRCEDWYRSHEAEAAAFLRQLLRERQGHGATLLRDFLRQAPDFAMLLNHCPDLIHRLDGLAGDGLFSHLWSQLKHDPERVTSTVEEFGS